ncbi:hypothetical protein SAMN05660653_01265 [Desulfonatronum thiosulfatophilum]|uniref:Uncharacterized protein n=1 Tax=Desulfonatronum thiosulfatophilum TaxID=617002 RepID=A0A1G6C0K3_9BACT|nr:hypothetical protein SAMN05660653_01265 [Desulfonatronum thiosulfatophilum]
MLQIFPESNQLSSQNLLLEQRMHMVAVYTPLPRSVMPMVRNIGQTIPSHLELHMTIEEACPITHPYYVMNGDRF